MSNQPLVGGDDEDDDDDDDDEPVDAEGTKSACVVCVTDMVWTASLYYCQSL